MKNNKLKIKSLNMFGIVKEYQNKIKTIQKTYIFNVLTGMHQMQM